MTPSAPVFRVCPKCDTAKPLDQFRGSRGSGKIRRWHTCHDCRKAQVREWRTSERGAIHRKKRKTAMYGLTPADYDRMFAEQGGACAICGATELPIDPRTKRPYELAIDHCHGSGKVRSLLCHHCNVGLGAFRDDPALLHAAVSYLARHSDVQIKKA